MSTLADRRLRPLLILSLVSLVTSNQPTFAQSDYTGMDWNAWSTDTRLMYLVGYADGRSNGAWEILLLVDEERWERARENEALEPVLKEFESSVTVGQLLLGVTKFYEDFRNLHIQVRDAVAVIFDEANGGTTLGDDFLQSLRSNAARRQSE